MKTGIINSKQKTRRNRKMLCKKKALSILIACSMMFNIGISLHTAEAGFVPTGTGDTSLIDAFMMANGLKISSDVKYYYSAPENTKMLVQCTAKGNKSKHPTVGDTGTYTCMARDMSNSIKITQNIQSKTIKFTEEGLKTYNIPFTGLMITDVVGSDGYRKNQQVDFMVTLSINVEPKQSDTSITDTSSENGSAATDPTVTTISTGTDSTVKDVANDGSLTCDDGSYWCPEEARGNQNGTINDPANDGPSSGTTTKSCTSDGTCTTQNCDSAGNCKIQICDSKGNCKTIVCLSDGTCKNILNGGDTGKGQGLNPGNIPTPNAGGNTTSGSNYSDLLRHLLDDNNGSYDSGDNNWIDSSAPSDTSGNLDDYFGDDVDGGQTPDGMTDDLTVGDDGGGDTYVNNGSDGDDGGDYGDGGVNVDYMGDGNNYYGDGGDGSSNDGDSGLPLQDLQAKYEDGLAGLDGLNGDNSGLLGAINAKDADSSLAHKLRELIGDGSITNNKRGTATDQELYDMAKKLLLASGYTLDQIKNGKNYDPNSAYTEPSTAWDMNRITTLLKGKRISLTSPTEVKSSNGKKGTSVSANAKTTK